MSVFSGKCLCGNVTYKCHAEPTVIFNCPLKTLSRCHLRFSNSPGLQFFVKFRLSEKHTKFEKNLPHGFDVYLK